MVLLPYKMPPMYGYGVKKAYLCKNDGFTAYENEQNSDKKEFRIGFVPIVNAICLCCDRYASARGIGRG